jgi:hypothetical protein
MTRISGNDGDLDWGGYHVGIKSWAIQLNQSANGILSWYGKMTISIADFKVMSTELLKAGSGSVGLDKLFPMPMAAIFKSAKSSYHGEILVDIEPSLSVATHDSMIGFRGTGPLMNA